MSMSLVTLLPAICSTVASVVGILLNIYVLFRLRRFARAEPNRFEYGCGLPLLAMAMADLLALVAFLPSMFSPFILIALEDYPILQTVFCKSMVYWTQVTTNMSMWCWVLMSAMRYTAIYHPFLHLRVWLLPRRGVQLIVLFSLLLNVCFIGAVEAKNMRCAATALFGSTHELTWWLHLAEIMWGFFVPAICTLLMDWRVLMIDPPYALVRRHVHFDLALTRSLSDPPMGSEHTAHIETTRVLKPRSAVLKWLAITSMDLLLNAPDNLLRLAIMFADPLAPAWSWYIPARVVAQICYFGQFGFNAIYLSMVAYNRSTNSKPSTALLSLGTQSSIVRRSPYQRGAETELPDLIRSMPSISQESRLIDPSSR